MQGQKKISFSSQEFIDIFHYPGELGVKYSNRQSEFRLWAPTASNVLLVTYPTGNDSKGTKTPMSKGEQGTWYLDVAGDLHGIYYNYLVTVDGMTQEAMDPYAKACGVNGNRGMVVDMQRTDPDGWQDLVRPTLSHFINSIIYELHVRDFTIWSESGVQQKGKFLGMTERGTTVCHSVSTGLDHLSELGITHVQLMPCYDFSTIDECKLDAEYNWGYDPQNYNIPEGSYATDPYHGGIRIREFKEMIMALKEQGIRVVLDVVYNHTYLAAESHLNKIVPGYYYRQDPYGNLTNGSGCGNELASERSMVRKMITDSVVYWANEYKIDGFRFDLMALLDIVTINEIRSALNDVDSSIIVYGEGWIGGHSPLPDNCKALKGNVRQLPGTGVFNDDVRDAVKGHVFFGEQPGFVNGAIGMEESVKCGIVGATDHDQVDYNQVLFSHFPWAAEPAQSINYVEAHDNYTLWDKLLKTNPNDSEEVRMAMHKMSAAIILTSQGIPFLHGGMEFLRSKNGDHNSYKSPDSINQINWMQKCKYKGIFSYYQGLIQLRKTHPAFRMKTTGEIQSNLCFLPMPAGQMLGYVLTKANADPWQKIVVVFNATSTGRLIDLPGNHWIIVVNQKQAGINELGRVMTDKVVVPGRTSLVLVEAESFLGN